ncbi:MAG: hypothetical protein IJ418_09215 [Clostridia bacterium]|nr:hypothetical protein [Clostridia bacterium]
MENEKKMTREEKTKTLKIFAGFTDELKRALPLVLPLAEFLAEHKNDEKMAG